jgi:hypothetical protein
MGESGGEARERRERPPHARMRDLLPPALSSGPRVRARVRTRGLSTLAAVERFAALLVPDEQAREEPGALDSLAAIVLLAGVVRDQRKLDDATRLVQKALATRRELGDEHPDTLAATNDLAQMLQDRGDLDGAEPLYREALAAQRRVLGAAHPNTLITISNLGLLLQARGNRADAEPLLREALAAAELAHGTAHPHRMTALTNLGALLFEQAKLAEAAPMLREALAGFRSAYGDAHASTRSAASWLAAVLRAQGEDAAAAATDNAAPLLREALAAQRIDEGDGSTETLKSARNLADLLFSLGGAENVAEAAVLADEALVGLRRNLGEAHSHTLAALRVRGRVLAAQADLAGASGPGGVLTSGGPLRASAAEAVSTAAMDKAARKAAAAAAAATATESPAAAGAEANAAAGVVFQEEGAPKQLSAEEEALEALLAKARPWMLRLEAGAGAVWRHAISGATQLYTPQAVLEAEAAQGRRKEEAARARALLWVVHADADGAAYYEDTVKGTTTYVKPKALRKLHALEAANASRALRAEAGEFVANEDLSEYRNLRTGATTRDVPPCIVRLARLDAAEAARCDREEAADWQPVAGGYEFLPDGSIAREKPAALSRVRKLDALEAARQRALAAHWLEEEDPATGDLYYYHAASDTTQWTLPTAAELAEAAAKAATFASPKGEAGAGRPPAARAAHREATARRLLDADAGRRRKEGFAAEAARDRAGAIAALVDDLRSIGLESSQMLVFVDCSAANATAGKRSFPGGRHLHDVARSSELGPNPYEETLTAIASSMAAFDADGRIPLFGFASKKSGDHAVFSLTPAGAAAEDAPCDGLDQVLATYRAQVLRVAPGATRSLVPVVRKAIAVAAAADKAGVPREMLIALVVVAGDSGGRIALNSALSDASRYPIVFVVVGVGDGPFADLERFDGALGQRLFDNLIFVKLEEVKDACIAARAPLDVGLALAALAELPQAFSECARLGHFGASDAAGTGAGAGAGAGTGKKAAR